MALIAMGAIDVGQSINAAQVVSDSSREGARYAARNGVSSVQEVEQIVSEFIANAFPNVSGEDLSAAITVAVEDENGYAIAAGDLTTVDAGASVAVRVQLQFNVVQLTQFVPGFDGVTMETTTVMRRE